MTRPGYLVNPAKATSNSIRDTKEQLKRNFDMVRSSNNDFSTTHEICHRTRQQSLCLLYPVFSLPFIDTQPPSLSMGYLSFHSGALFSVELLNSSFPQEQTKDASLDGSLYPEPWFYDRRLTYIFSRNLPKVVDRCYE